jgi:hypothetical protein
MQYLYQKNKWALPGNLQNQKSKEIFKCSFTSSLSLSLWGRTTRSTEYRSNGRCVKCYLQVTVSSRVPWLCSRAQFIPIPNSRHDKISGNWCNKFTIAPYPQCFIQSLYLTASWWGSFVTKWVSCPDYSFYMSTQQKCCDFFSSLLT